MHIGRFAPSPTGPLHHGSLLTALASFLAVKQKQGCWLIRIDDIDPPRAEPGAEANILACLAAHGLVSDAPVVYQSAHSRAYDVALKKLAAHTFYCTCSRRELADHPLYPGTCRAHRHTRADSAIRLNTQTTQHAIEFADGFAGHQTVPLARLGDFIVRRRDGLIAYHLATAVDDSADDDDPLHTQPGRITEVLRGQDLLDVTPAQLLIMRLLGQTPPQYTHIPILSHPDGSKLSKQTGAPAVDVSHSAENLHWALTQLGQQPPTFEGQPNAYWLQWGVRNWNLDRIPRHFAPFQT